MSGRIADVLPLTPVQEGLLFHAVRDREGADPYLVQARFRLGPGLTAETVRDAVTALLDRHPNLRACFRHERLDRPVQVIPHTVPLPWREADLTGRTEAEAAAAVEELLAEDRTRRFDLARPPVLRALFLRYDTGSELLLSFHHILLDGWSVPVLERDLAALVTGRPLPPAVPHRQYALWLSRQDRGLAEAAWSEALAGLERPAPLVPESPPSGQAPPDTARLHLTAELTAALTRRAAEAGVTLNTVTQAAWALVLARMTGGRDLVFGGVVAGRPHDLPGAGEMVGLFINTLPVRVRLRDGETTGELLTRLQDEQWRLAPHHHVRLADVQRAAGAAASGPAGLFDSVLAFENFPRGSREPGDDGPDTVRVTDVRDATHYPVTLAVVAGERVLLSVGCRHGLDATAVAARVVRAFEQLAGDLATPVDRIDVLPEEERRRLLARSAGPPAAPVDGPATVTARFAAQVARTPDAPAVESGDDVLTYAGLDAAADRLARRLAAAGVGPGSVVGLLLGRSPSLVVAQLAVLKAGACWLPLDAAHPAERLARLLDGAAARLVLTEGEPSVPLPAGVRTLAVRGRSPESAEPAASPHPEAPACVMYTSGSSGEPKAVVVPQRAIVELAADTNFGGGHGPGAHHRVLLHSPHTFDAATYEVWVPLLTGGTVVICPDEPLTPGLLARVLPERRVTALWLTAELFRTVAELAPGSPGGLRELWTGGDVVDAAAVRRVRRHCPGTVVVNGYGPTEATVFATAHRVQGPGPSGPPPIGRPLDGTRVHLLDARLRPVPDGRAGEVYLAGAGLAHGYLGRPAATAERFVADPYGPPGTRMYRTGDLARRTPEGTLVFVGRADDQVKVRGFRVEPAEVEAALTSCPGVRRAVVAARPAPGGGKRLVAWVVPDEEHGRPAPGAAGGDPGPLAHVRSAAARVLPPHLLPTAWVRVDAVPLTPHGKADRAALPDPPAGPTAAATRAPRTAREKELCALFGEVLGGGTEAGPDTDFFASGGHSLSALRLAGRIEEAWGVRVPVATLFAAPTPARLIARLDDTTEPGAFGKSGSANSASASGGPVPGASLPVGAESLAPLLALRAGGDRAPLFCVHPGLGVSWAYTALLPHLAPDRPVHALQTPALSAAGAGPAHLPSSVAELAESYLYRIRAVRPHGPYLLLGTSFGGPVAHEMAVRLRASGEEVALLAVVDAMPKPPEAVRTPLAPAVVEAEARRILREDGAALDGIGEHRLTALAAAVARHVVIGRSWVPSRYDGTVTLFAATRDPEAIPTEEKAAAWRRAATAVAVHELPCAHAEVLHAEQAARIAATLEAALAGRTRTPLQGE
ncbi:MULTISPECIES: non-ribosomal peptide synthetase [Streptomyces]|uniref:non-ribosomal peptide synthetase n=1 Tax=Streptomyces TaxID=1883 RepID=UPI001E4D09FA|nr:MULTISPECIES: non-ribosomal peptide synthetase [Streptomyces]UFQ18049.1 amino acid adenylation domain-containing protein [Streptomyces huasconensis]WCL87660.1 non-ribosomal peptide synthetase [Streptomyces sp. JCM 35825]